VLPHVALPCAATNTAVLAEMSGHSDAPSLVLWDVDGTLITESTTSESTYAAAVMAVLPGAKVEPPANTSGGTDFGILLSLFTSLGLAQDDAELLVAPALFELERATANVAKLREERTVLAGVPAALAAFHQRGVVQTLVTGNSRPRAEAKIRAAGLAHLDLRCGGFGDRERERWRLVIAAQALAGLIGSGDSTAIERERTAVIGDTIHDIRAARDAGVVAVAVASGSGSRDELASANPDLLLDSLEDGLEELLLRLGRM
jgi:phosphoglycolate phosphatase